MCVRERERPEGLREDEEAREADRVGGVVKEESGAVAEIGGVGGGHLGVVEEARKLGGGNWVVEDVLADDEIGRVEEKGNGVNLE